MSDWKTLGFVLIYIVLECLFNCVESCSFEGETEHIEKKFDLSDVVIYGDVRYQHPPPMSGANYYTATVNVHCTLKGPQQKTVLNISDAGGRLPPDVNEPPFGCPAKKCYTTESTTTITTTTIPPVEETAEEKHIPNDHSSINEVDNTIDDKEKTDRVVAASHSAGSSAAKIVTMTTWVPFFIQIWASYT